MATSQLFGEDLGQRRRSTRMMESGRNDHDEGSSVYRTSAEYYEALNKWMAECNRWYAYHALFPYYIAQHINSLGPQQQSSLAAATAASSGTSARTQNNDNLPNRQDAGSWRDYKVACLWKRVVAEIIDFLLLFTIKFFVTFIAVDYFELIDIERYSKALKIDKLDKISYTMLIELTTELMVLEIINRLVICFFEALCLKGGNSVVAGPGGATPGKNIMGLKVISCEMVMWTLNPESGRIKVQNASDLGFWRAFGRSAVKNLSIALCMPASFTVQMFQHNRAIYDVFFHCIVVEELHQRQPAWQRRLFA